FDDLLEANDHFAENVALSGFDGIARAGVAMVTCMDSRIDPLRMIGLQAGDAKILRNPGGRVTDQVLVALVLSVTELNVERVLLVEHTRCAMGSSTEDEMHRKVSGHPGTDGPWLTLGIIPDQRAAGLHGRQKGPSHPLVGDHITV